MVLRLMFALPGVHDLLVTVVRAIAEASPSNLAPAKGCQDDTTSPSASNAARQSAPMRPTHSANARDDREAPLLSVGTKQEHKDDSGVSQQDRKLRESVALRCRPAAKVLRALSTSNGTFRFYTTRILALQRFAFVGHASPQRRKHQAPVAIST